MSKKVTKVKLGIITGLGLLIGACSTTHEFEHGGYLCKSSVSYSACNLITQQQGRVKRLDGWYMSAATTWLGYPNACIVKGSDTRFLFHGVTTSRVPPHSSIWEGILHDNPVYYDMMNRTPWGARIYRVVRERGWLDRPDLHTMTGEEAIALGVPVCK